MRLRLTHRARRLAIRYVQSAITALDNPFIENGRDYYSVALRTHFVFQHDAENTRHTIQEDYVEILAQLMNETQFFYAPDSFTCIQHPTWGGYAVSEDTLYNMDDELLVGSSGIYICRPFTEFIGDNVRAIVLIHEATHMIGVIMENEHAPYRGSITDASTQRHHLYNFGITQPEGATTQERMENPDAYAFFAAHIFSQRDTTLAHLSQDHRRFIIERRRQRSTRLSRSHATSIPR